MVALFGIFNCLDEAHPHNERQSAYSKLMDLNDNLILRHFKFTYKINHDRIESTRKVGINILSKRAHLSSSSECNMKEVVFAESLMWLGEPLTPASEELWSYCCSKKSLPRSVGHSEE